MITTNRDDERLEDVTPPCMDQSQNRGDVDIDIVVDDKGCTTEPCERSQLHAAQRQVDPDENRSDYGDHNGIAKGSEDDMEDVESSER